MPPATATGAGPEHVETGLGVAAFSKPIGYSSTKAVLNVADTNLWELVNVITSNDVPPALMMLGVNVLETCGKLAVMVSTSEALQVPDTQPAATLVFVTPAGADIEAVLVICVCESAICGTAKAIRKPRTSGKRLNNLEKESLENFKWLNNLAITNM